MLFDYSREPHSDIAFVDMKSFYASCECVRLGLNPLTTSLCVMSRSDNSAGLILASSPVFKQVFGKKNVSRSYDLPFDLKTRKFNSYAAKKQGLPTDPAFIASIESWAKRTLIVPPRMNAYIQVNMEIQKVFQEFAAPDDIFPYSIDEGFIDLTSSLNYFIPDPSLSRKEKLDLLSARIQKRIWQETGIYSTIGLSNANPLLAKLALDNEAKHCRNMRSNWSYEDVERKVWKLPQLTDFWGIGRRTEKRLQKIGITSIAELAQAHPDLLKKEFGVMGLQLWFHAHGIDESNVHKPYRPKSRGIGNSQILPYDYYLQADIELVFREMAEQVAIRLRRKKKKTQLVSIHASYSKIEGLPSIHCQQKIEPTQSTKVLSDTVLRLFRSKYKGGAIRQIGVFYGELVEESLQFFSLFDDPVALEKEEKLQQTIDRIRDQFGFTSLQKGSSLLENSRAIARSKLTGGHSAGGLDGLT